MLSVRPAGSYNVSATAVDASNNTDASPATRAFTLAGAPDTQAPAPTVTSPSRRSTRPSRCRRWTIGGNVTDNTGTTAVRITIQDTVSQAVVDRNRVGRLHQRPDDARRSPGSTSTTWSYTFNPPAAGKYGYQVTAVDAAGNVSAKTAWRTVTLN